MSSESWFYVDGGQKQGPVSTEELQALSRSGRIGADTLVWREGWSDTIFTCRLN